MAKVKNVILVTGASSGIGAAIARLCAKKGYLVVATARRGERLRQLAAGTPGITSVAADITLSGSAKKLVAKARILGNLRGIVHSAGTFHTASVEKIDFDQWAEMMETNVTAAARLLQAGMADLAGGGVFVGISSTAGLRPVAGYSAYCASKGALNSFLQSAALELAPRGIRVHAVAPGVVETPMMPDAKSKAGLHPLGRSGTPDDVAQAVAFLLAPQSEWMTGLVMPVDGGISLT